MCCSSSNDNRRQAEVLHEFNRASRVVLVVVQEGIWQREQVLVLVLRTHHPLKELEWPSKQKS